MIQDVPVKEEIYKKKQQRQKQKRRKKPDWLRVKLPTGKNYRKVSDIVEKYNLNTICQSGNCPNMGECWGRGTATFMILGNVCTRSCSFCAVSTGLPGKIDWDEPQRIAEAVDLMGIEHCVLTSVDRDELPDKGARIWSATVRAVRALNPGTTLETLVPDFKGDEDSIEQIIEVAPEVVSHNMETVKRLHRLIRPQAKYERSLKVLRKLKQGGMRTKSGIMVGLGEKEEEVYEIMDDLLAVGCDVLTIGQYLQPTKMHVDVDHYVKPEVFNRYKEVGLEKGFDMVESGPMVRSSYHAEKHVKPSQRKN